MVDDVVAKRVWKFDSGLCKTIPVLNFSKKVVWGCLSIDLKGLDRYCFGDLLRNGTSFDTPPKKWTDSLQKKPPAYLVNMQVQQVQQVHDVDMA